MAEQFKFHLLNKAYAAVVGAKIQCISLNRGKRRTNIKQIDVRSFCKNKKSFEIPIIL